MQRIQSQDQKTFFRHNNKNLYLLVAGLTVCDILTTYTCSIVMGSFFGEMGFVARYLMRTFHDVWPLFMFMSEFAIFGLTAFFFAKSKANLSMINWKLPLRYMPVITMLAMIANNATIILLFTLRA